MAKIRAEDVAEVRDRARIDEVVRETVELKPAGGGSYKGLCPFHEERSPSFQVSPAKGLWYCFGCGEGGDTIDFVRRVDALSFAEAVEKLAGKFGISLRYEEGSAAPARQQGLRTRLVAANRAAAEFFRRALATEEAEIGRTFLTERGFDDDVRATFGVGYAPQSWDALTNHLRSAGFRDDELTAAGLVSAGQRGNYDRFRGRLVWPIRDLAGDVVGFGARRLFPEDQGPKYLNTPETPLYKKSHVLYGIDLARKDISKQQRAVVVEGYTDVMACHLAGVTTAIATCGTSFGADHVRVLRRLLLDTDAMSGEVVFTFDGDAAGQRAALRAFESDQAFVAQTYVAVEPAGLDPCDLRLASGDEAVRQLVESRVPMFEFAMRARLSQHDLDTAEGRVAALRDAAPLVSSIRDQALRSEYLTSLGGWLGMEPGAVRDAVRAASRGTGRHGGRSDSGPGGSRGRGGDSGPGGAATEGRPGASPGVGPVPGGGEGVGDRGHSEVRGSSPRTTGAAGGAASTDYRLETQAIQVMLQHPQLVRAWIEAVESTAFTDPGLRSVFAAIAAVGPPAEDGTTTDREWLELVLAAATDDGVRAAIRGWTVLGLPLGAGADVAVYADSVMAKLQSGDVTRRIAPLKGRLARSDPKRDAVEFNELMAQLMELETYRRQLQDQSQGGGV